MATDQAFKDGTRGEARSEESEGNKPEMNGVEEANVVDAQCRRKCLHPRIGYTCCNQTP